MHARPHMWPTCQDCCSRSPLERVVSGTVLICALTRADATAPATLVRRGTTAPRPPTSSAASTRPLPPPPATPGPAASASTTPPTLASPSARAPPAPRAPANLSCSTIAATQMTLLVPYHARPDCASGCSGVRDQVSSALWRACMFAALRRPVILNLNNFRSGYSRPPPSISLVPR